MAGSLINYKNEKLIQHSTNDSVSICAACGKPFQQEWSPSREIYSNFKTCGACRIVNARGGINMNIDYEPHWGQELVHASAVRYKIICAGARWGKDRCSIMEGIDYFIKCLNEERGADIVPHALWWIIAPTDRIANQNWREIIKYFPAELVVDVSKTTRTIQTINGGIIEVHSAYDPESLVAVGLDLVTITEAARIPDLEDVWANLEARLNSPGKGLGGKGGRAIINSSPLGKNYFYKMWGWGMPDSSDYDPDFESWRFSTWDNPYMAVRGDEIRKNGLTYKENLRKRMSDKRYRQDYCVVPETMIYGDVVRRADEIKVGDLVYSHTGKLRKVNKVMERQHNGDLICIKSYKGDGFLKLTPEHPVMAVKSVKSRRELEDFVPQWIPAGDLKAGDFIAYPSELQKHNEANIEQFDLSSFSKGLFLEADDGRIYYKPKWTTKKPTLRKNPKKTINKIVPTNRDVLRMIGLWLADGSINSGNTPTWSFSLEEMHLCLEVKHTLEKWFRLKNVRIYEADRSLCVKSTNIFLSNFLIFLCGQGARHKKISELIISLSDRQVSDFLSGYFDGDGFYGFDRANAVTASVVLSKQVRYLLKRLGIDCSVNHIKRTEGIIRGKKINSSDSYQVQIFGEDLVRLYDTFSVNRDVKEPQYSKIYEKNGYKWGRILDIKKETYSGSVYNYEVDTDNTYLTENGIVHNCAEFISEVNMAFPNAVDCFVKLDNLEAKDRNAWKNPEPYETYVIGYDPATGVGEDEPMVWIRNSKGRVVLTVSLRGFGWDPQWDRIAFYSKHYNGALCKFGRTGLGEVIESQLAKRGVPNEPVDERGGNKERLVENLAVIIEQKMCEIPWSQEVENQFNDYVGVKNKSGGTSYGNATRSGHDDHVSAAYFCFDGFIAEKQTVPYMGRMVRVARKIS